MVRNGSKLLHLNPPIKDMLINKLKLHGVSYGLGEAGYDICLKQDIHFGPIHNGHMGYAFGLNPQNSDWTEGRFTLASAIEEFQMPNDLVGIVHDKSTWARKGLSVFNTVIEPGWNGFLTLELVYHGSTDLHIPAGSGIAQVIFHELSDSANYNGKYQNQENEPVSAKFLNPFCEAGLHSWVNNGGEKLPSDTKCFNCDELYGDPD